MAGMGSEISGAGIPLEFPLGMRPEFAQGF